MFVTSLPLLHEGRKMRANHRIINIMSLDKELVDAEYLRLFISGLNKSWVLQECSSKTKRADIRCSFYFIKFQWCNCQIAKHLHNLSLILPLNST